MQEIDTVTEIVIWLAACAIGAVLGTVIAVLGTVIFHAVRATVVWIVAKIRGRG